MTVREPRSAGAISRRLEQCCLDADRDAKEQSERVLPAPGRAAPVGIVIHILEVLIGGALVKDRNVGCAARRQSEPVLVDDHDRVGLELWVIRRAMQRMIQAGAAPMTSLQYLLELQRDWARTTTYDMTTGIAKRVGGAYGLGITYAKAMFDASEGH